MTKLGRVLAATAEIARDEERKRILAELEALVRKEAQKFPPNASDYINVQSVIWIVKGKP